MEKLPDGLEAYQRTATFTETTVPKGLLKDHATKPGVWGLLHVVTGELLYWPGKGSGAIVVRPNRPAVIEPTVKHRVEVRDPVTFYVEFWR